MSAPSRRCPAKMATKQARVSDAHLLQAAQHMLPSAHACSAEKRFAPSQVHGSLDEICKLAAISRTASPSIVSGLAPLATARRVISLRPRVISAARALGPKPSPSLILQGTAGRSKVPSSQTSNGRRLDEQAQRRPGSQWSSLYRALLCCDVPAIMAHAWYLCMRKQGSDLPACDCQHVLECASQLNACHIRRAVAPEHGTAHEGLHPRAHCIVICSDGDEGGLRLGDLCCEGRP